MKRIITVLLICLCLVLSACAKKPDAGAADVPAGQPTAAPVDTAPTAAPTEAVPTAAPTEEPAPTAVPTSEPAAEPTQEPEEDPVQVPEGETGDAAEPEPLTILTHAGGYTAYTDDIERKGYVEYDLVTLPKSWAGLYPELAASLKDYSESRKTLMQGTLDRLCETYDELLAAGDEYGLHELMSSEHIVIKRADTNLVSFDNAFSEYNGGVHGYYGIEGYTFDSRTGKLLGIKDIVKDTDAFAGLAAQQLTDESGEEIMLDLVPDYDLTAYIKALAEEEALNFTVSPYGVTISFNPYGIGAYASGIISTTVYFDAHEELFNDKYIPAADRYAKSAGENLCIEDDFDMDGDTEGLWVYGTETDDYGDYEGIAVQFDGSDMIYRIDAYGWGLDAYLMHTGHGNYLYVESTGDSDVTVTHVFEIVNAGKINYLGAVELSTDETPVYYSDDEYDYDYYRAVAFDPESFEMSYRHDMIGTNFLSAYFAVGEDGMPQLLDEYYSFSYPYELTSRVELELEGISTETFMHGDTVVVPAGSMYRMIYTDGINTVILELEDGRGVVMELDVENHFGCYKDVPLDDIFDGILYAG